MESGFPFESATNLVAGGAGVLVTVSAFREPYEAHLFRGRLEAEGIFAVVSHEMHVANKWMLSNALGGVKVQVSADEIELAREVERACCRGDYREILRQELGDLDDPVCPYCGGTEYRKRRPFPRAALAVALSMMTSSVLPPVGWILRCERCFKEYRAPHRPISVAKQVLAGTAMVAALIGLLALQHWFNKVFGCYGQFPCL
ncbi:hypothetical protein GCM10008942_03440 [Rhizomicrobium electricum]|uniref:DUF2007 domain-containing protein n=1 Tax=Rhizomicrobium electricum TaxID=480070 RepID=A0ABN1E400_9PROT